MVSISIALVMSATAISIPDNDVISYLHTGSVLIMHHVPYDVMGGLSTSFVVRKPPKNLIGILEREAPPDKFSMRVKGFRTFSNVNSKKTWVVLTRRQRIGKASCVIKVGRVLAAKKIESNDVLQMKYWKRTYLGRDLESHSGYELMIVSKRNTSHIQLFELEGKPYLVDEDSIGSSFAAY